MIFTAEANIREKDSEKKTNRYSNVKLEVKIHQRHFLRRLVGLWVRAADEGVC